MSVATAETQRLITETIGLADLAAVTPAIAGEPAGKNFLSMHQLSAADIAYYMAETNAAGRMCREARYYPRPMLPRELRAVMRQPSTRTAGSIMTANHKLGGQGVLVSGMESSSEAKGESLADSWVAFAAQSDIIGARTAEEYGPAFAAHSIAEVVRVGRLAQMVPVINLGDGRNEHPTQTIGDLFTIQQAFDGQLHDLTLTLVGDHERYRVHHSQLIAAVILRLRVIIVESSAAPLPQEYADMLGDLLLLRTDNLDEVLGKTDVLCMGRNPDEYAGEDAEERARSEQLSRDFGRWVIDFDRVQQLPTTSIVLHPRPRRNEIHTSADWDARLRDVEQMQHAVWARMAILAGVFGESLVEYWETGSF